MKLFNLGFNHGYFLKKHFSSFHNTLISTIQVGGEYSSGFKEGSFEFTKELEQNKLNDLKKIRSISKGQGREDIER